MSKYLREIKPEEEEKLWFKPNRLHNYFLFDTFMFSSWVGAEILLKSNSHNGRTINSVTTSYYKWIKFPSVLKELTKRNIGIKLVKRKNRLALIKINLETTVS